MARLIAHLDMDAFYASVELLRYPELRGRAVVIGGGRDSQPSEARRRQRTSSARLRHYTGRGVVTTSTYEARKLGVFSAMGMMKSALLAPDAILLPVDFDEYRKYSRLFKAAVREIAPIIEDRGIDEIYVDLSDDARRARRRRARDRQRHQGGGARAHRPHLLDRHHAEQAALEARLRARQARRPDAARPRRHAGAHLAARRAQGERHRPESARPGSPSSGIETIGDIAAADPAFLLAHFGKSFGAWLHEASHGRDERPVVTSSEPKSISRETTFDRDLHAVRDRAELGAIFTELCEQLAGDLARKSYAAKTIGIKLRFDDFKIATRDLTLPAHTLDARAIRRAAGSCLKRVDLTQAPAPDRRSRRRAGPPRRSRRAARAARGGSGAGSARAGR